MCSASVFTSAPKPDFCPNIVCAPSEQIAQTISHQISLFLKKLSTSFSTSIALVDVVRGDKIKNRDLSRLLSHSARILQADLDWQCRWSRQVGN